MNTKLKIVVLFLILAIFAGLEFAFIERTNSRCAYEQAEIEKVKKDQKANIERDTHQGTSGLGRSSWGSF